MLRSRSLLFVVTFLASGCSAAKDMENVCNAGERSQANKIADPAERAHATAMWVEKNVKTTKVKKGLGALAGISDPRVKGQVLKEMAVESGYNGPCPMADELLAQPPYVPPSATPEPTSSAKKTGLAIFGGRDAEERLALDIEKSKTPIRDVSRELTMRGAELYGRPIPVFLGYSSDAAAFAEEVAKLGCPKGIEKRYAPGAKKAKELLTECKPHGPALLSRYAIAKSETTVGLAALALALEVAASDDVKKSPVHEAFVAALLGPARPNGPAD